ncbi:hypothetical protein K9M79_08685 [Candidatus Woesearchaeota archaeon]|nr:hypothetical protein [Candidatus Woesearchaeota archaeon]
MADYSYVNFFVTMNDKFGLMEALLPFLLIFVLIFAILQKTKVLGDGRKNFNVVLAMIMGLAVVIPHVTNSYPPGADIVDIINQALPQVSIVIVAIVMLLIMVGVFGHRLHFAGTSLATWLVIFSILVIGYIFTNAAGWWGQAGEWPRWLDWLSNPETQALVIVLLIFGIIVGFITSDDSDDSGKNGLMSAFEKFGDVLKGD